MRVMIDTNVLLYADRQGREYDRRRKQKVRRDP